MNGTKTHSSSAVFMAILLTASGGAVAIPYSQCPGDDFMLAADGVTLLAGNDAVPDPYRPNPTTGLPDPALPNPNFRPEVKCMHLGAGDGYVTMADDQRYLQYIFSFADLTGTDTSKAMVTGMLAANFPAPTIALEQGQEFYLSLTNVGMASRPDLSDPHTVHFHGYPQAMDTFDGLPESAVSINMGSTLTYYYNIVEPGTYMYHCHVEATEHMQMGMLGNLYVHSAQDKTAAFAPLCGTGPAHNPGDRYAYNDCDGSTAYQVEAALQLGAFDSVFHDASMNVQPLPFADMKANYAMLNGRGYPDTVNTGTLPPPADNGGKPSQPVSALVTAQTGQTILLRLSNLNITNFYTVRALGLPMQVVGRGARLARGPDGKALYYQTANVEVGPGEGVDVLIDTTGVAAGTYFLYTTNLNYLTNNQEDFGGLMTEIRITTPPPAI